jgi:hypothetical protein
MAALVPTLITIIISVLSIYTTSHKQAVLSGSTCIRHSVPSSSNNRFLCTRELAACNFLVVAGVAYAVLGGQKGTAVADMRVEKLRQKDEDWEESTVYESMRNVEKP